MSKWTDIRDAAIGALQADSVGKDIKGDFLAWLEQEGLAFLQDVADRVITECKADAESEGGWCRIRDAFVLPVVISIGMYVLQMVIDKAEKSA